VLTAVDALDEKLPEAVSIDALFKNLDSVGSGRLTKGEAFAFKIAAFDLIYPLRHWDGGLKEAEQDSAALRVVAGLTPRQVILLGNEFRILRAIVASAENPKEKEDTDAIVRESTAIIKLYSKPANQSPEATTSARTKAGGNMYAENLPVHSYILVSAPDAANCEPITAKELEAATEATVLIRKYTDNHGQSGSRR
jgi:hypothetical protein